MSCLVITPSKLLLIGFTTTNYLTWRSLNLLRIFGKNSNLVTFSTFSIMYGLISMSLSTCFSQMSLILLSTFLSKAKKSTQNSFQSIIEDPSERGKESISNQLSSEKGLFGFSMCYSSSLNESVVTLSFAYESLILLGT